MNELNNKIIRIKARENWANAEARYYRVLAGDIYTANAAGYDVHGKPVLDVMNCSNCRTPGDWVRIWSLVAERLHKYRKNLVLQYAYGRNPANVSQYADAVNSEGGV